MVGGQLAGRKSVLAMLILASMGGLAAREWSFYLVFWFQPMLLFAVTTPPFARSSRSRLNDRRGRDWFYYRLTIILLLRSFPQSVTLGTTMECDGSAWVDSLARVTFGSYEAADDAICDPEVYV